MTDFRLPRIEIDREQKEIRVFRLSGETWERVATLDARWTEDTIDARFNHDEITSLNLTIFAENIEIIGDWDFAESPRISITKEEIAFDPDPHAR